MVVGSVVKMGGGPVRWRERSLPEQSEYFRRWYYDVVRVFGSLTVTTVP